MSSSEPQKKLKQSRLPFSPVDPSAIRKRKLSYDDVTAKSPKLDDCTDENSSIIIIENKQPEVAEGKPTAQDEVQPLKEKRKLEREKKEEEKRLREKKKEEERLKKEEEKLQKEKKKEEERLKREEEKLQKEKKKEEERLKREEERLQKEKKREEERKKKEEDRLKKEEERKKKEDEKTKKEEDKKRKELEKKQAEEEELEKKKRVKEKFAQFFVAKSNETAKTPAPSTEHDSTANGYFSLFQPKDNMKVAPVLRRSLPGASRLTLEDVLKNDSEATKSDLYVARLRSGAYIASKDTKTFPIQDFSDDDCEILSDDGVDAAMFCSETSGLEEQPKRRRRAKLLQFCENSRPAYYGTWSKRSSAIKGRRPFSRDEVFDYEYDSDEDWEDIEAGETLSDSDAADNEPEDEANQYEVDNDFFVPHGYLSDGEGEGEGEEGQPDGDDRLSGPADAADPNESTSDDRKIESEDLQKKKLKQKQEEFDLEMKQKTKQQKPKVYGCIWLGDATCHTGYDQLLKVFMQHEARLLYGSLPVDLNQNVLDESKSNSSPDDEDETSKKISKIFPEQAMSDLIRLLHGNRLNKKFVAREFCEFWKRKIEEEAHLAKFGALSVRKIEQKIHEIGQYERIVHKGVAMKYKTWNVHNEIKNKYGLPDLSPSNKWKYILTPSSRRGHELSTEEKPEEATPDVPSTPTSSKNLITKFTKVLGEEDKRKLISPTSSESNVKKPKISHTPIISGAKTPKITGSKDSPIVKTPDSSDISRQKSAAATPLSAYKPASSKRPTPRSIASLFKNTPHKTSKADQTNADSKISAAADTECIVLD